MPRTFSLSTKARPPDHAGSLALQQSQGRATLGPRSDPSFPKAAASKGWRVRGPSRTWFNPPMAFASQCTATFPLFKPHFPHDMRISMPASPAKSLMCPSLCSDPLPDSSGGVCLNLTSGSQHPATQTLFSLQLWSCVQRWIISQDEDNLQHISLQMTPRTFAGKLAAPSHQFYSIHKYAEASLIPLSLRHFQQDADYPCRARHIMQQGNRLAIQS